jgi:hypothetical protein
LAIEYSGRWAVEMNGQNQPVIVPLLILPSLFFGGVIGWFQVRRRSASWQEKPRIVGILRGFLEVLAGLALAFLGAALSIPEDRSLPIAVPAILLAGYFLTTGMSTALYFFLRPILSILDAEKERLKNEKDQEEGP